MSKLADREKKFMDRSQEGRVPLIVAVVVVLGVFGGLFWRQLVTVPGEVRLYADIPENLAFVAGAEETVIPSALSKTALRLYVDDMAGIDPENIAEVYRYTECWAKTHCSIQVFFWEKDSRIPRNFFLEFELEGKPIPPFENAYMWEDPWISGGQLIRYGVLHGPMYTMDAFLLSALGGAAGGVLAFIGTVHLWEWYWRHRAHNVYK